MARLILLIPMLAITVALGAQASKAPVTGKGDKPGTAASVATPAPADASPSQDELIQVKQIPYLAALKRDPFSAPTDVEQASKGDLVDDIGVKGWLKSGGVSYAVVSDSRGNTKKLPIGYKFRDGEIVAIDEKSVTFHQWDISSTNRSVYRTVVKTFKREEGKR
jgi:hypothetical protein